MTPPPLLEAHHLDIRVADRWLCRGLELSLEAGQCLVLVGPNGAGKTTLLHTLAGLRPPAGGSLRLLGESYSARTARHNARLRGLLPQTPADSFAASVLETALVGRHPHLGRWAWEGPADHACAHAALAAVDMAALAGRELHSLSGGERQRVAIAALLVQAPKLYLLDEPLNHLDLHHQVATLELLRRLTREGCGVAMVLHDLNLAARYADQAVLLDGRGGVAAGTVGEVLQAERLSQAFGHPLRRYDIEGHATFVPA